MKLIRFGLISLISFLFLVGNVSTQDKLVIANGYADKGDHFAAIKAYKEVLEAYGSAEGYYNLANSYLAVDSLPQAILNYERALRYSPNDADIMNNLDIARNRVFDQVTVLPEFFLVEYWNALVRWLTPNGWAFLSIILALTLSLFYYLHSYGRINIRLRYYVGIMALIFLIMVVAIAASWSGKHFATAENRAIIMDQVLLKSGPDERSDDVKVLHPGYKVYILDELSGWKKIRTEDREVGYILPDAYENI